MFSIYFIIKLKEERKTIFLCKILIKCSFRPQDDILCVRFKLFNEYLSFATWASPTSIVRFFFHFRVIAHLKRVCMTHVHNYWGLILVHIFPEKKIITLQYDLSSRTLRIIKHLVSKGKYRVSPPFRLWYIY